MLKVSENKLKELIEKGKCIDGKPILTFAHTDWCSECRMIKPIIESIEAEYASKLLVVDIDADTVSDDYIRDYGVDELPTINVIDAGRIFDPCTDKHSIAGISNYIEECLKDD